MLTPSDLDGPCDVCDARATHYIDVGAVIFLRCPRHRMVPADPIFARLKSTPLPGPADAHDWCDLGELDAFGPPSIAWCRLCGALRLWRHIEEKEPPEYLQIGDEDEAWSPTEPACGGRR